MKSFADLYFGTRFFEHRKLYELLGVRVFKKFLPGSGDIAMRRKGRNLIKNGKTETLREYYESTKEYEKIHLVYMGALFGIFSIFALILIAYGITVSSLLFLLFLFVILNLLFNIYPIMLQRYSRVRIEKILKKRSERQTGKNGGTHADS